MLQKTAKVLLLQLNDESNNNGNEAPPLRSAGLSFLFSLCRSELGRVCNLLHTLIYSLTKTFRLSPRGSSAM